MICDCEVAVVFSVMKYEITVSVSHQLFVSDVPGSYLGVCCAGGGSEHKLYK